MGVTTEGRESALHIVQEQLDLAVGAPKCHQCGCLQKTVEALAATEPGRPELAPVLAVSCRN